MVASLSTYYPNANQEERIDLNILRLLSKAPTIAALSYKKSIGQPFIYPRNDLSYTENFLHMMFAVPAEPYVCPVRRPGAQPALDPPRRSRAELQHLDRAHGGQQPGQPLRLDRGRHQRALGPAPRWRQPEGHRDAGDDPRTAATTRSTSTWPRTRSSGFRLMGFGHRVYKNFDPRARSSRSADDVLAELGVDDPCSRSPRTSSR